MYCNSAPQWLEWGFLDQSTWRQQRCCWIPQQQHSAVQRSMLRELLKRLLLSPGGVCHLHPAPTDYASGDAAHWLRWGGDDDADALPFDVFYGLHACPPVRLAVFRSGNARQTMKPIGRALTLTPAAQSFPPPMAPRTGGGPVGRRL